MEKVQGAIREYNDESSVLFTMLLKIDEIVEWINKRKKPMSLTEEAKGMYDSWTSS